MKKIIETKGAPAPVGPYNQAILVGQTLYVSGQIALDPATGALITDSIELETKQVMRNLEAILAEAGATFEDVVKCTVFVTDMNQYGQINKIYSSFFNDNTAPARELVEVRNLPKFVNVEVSAIAYIKK
ncbi:UNVERIFIED_CONTAM: hypothetical protein GTU68_006966 [Idotea baltica]|nr:hypothetical protein [Idotea baltica]